MRHEPGQQLQLPAVPYRRTGLVESSSCTYASRRGLRGRRAFVSPRGAWSAAAWLPRSESSASPGLAGRCRHSAIRSDAMRCHPFGPSSARSSSQSAHGGQDFPDLRTWRRAAAPPCSATASPPRCARRARRQRGRALNFSAAPRVAQLPMRDLNASQGSALPCLGTSRTRAGGPRTKTEAR